MGDFAKSQLEKFGWSEGKGLGKNEDGIVEALRPKLKFDTTGIGHRDTSGNQWWNTVFNKAASNISVDSSASSKPVFKVNSSIALDIAAAKLNINIGEVKSKDSSLVYGNFVKTCTLQGDKETKSAAQEKRTDDDDKLLFKNFIVDDEKLFKACKGRTAHKGARHGLKLSGKLARIQQQEQELVEQMNSLGDLSDEWTKVKSKSKKHKCHKEKADCDSSVGLDKSRVEPVVESTVTDLLAQIDAQQDQDQDLELDSGRKGSKKTRRKMKRKFDELTEQLSSSLSLADDSPTQSRKVKKKNDSDCAGETADTNTDDCKVKSKNKKHRKVTTDSNILNCKINKKKKKKHEKKEKAKLQFISDNFTNLGLEETADDVSKTLVKSAKKKKKKSKK